jgi:hypothetical protein
MAKLLIIHAPARANIVGFTPDVAQHMGVKQAMLDIADDIEGVDIYEIARKLAEMLLEQVR